MKFSIKLTNASISIIFFFLTIFSSQIISAQKLAFPTARGAGAYVNGGRGLEVYHVTNLNNSGKGSLRDALSEGNRTIVFDVSGVIRLTSPLNLQNKSNITIAGQTAPLGGVTIDGDLVHFSGAENIIVRHIRFKGGIDSKAYERGPTNSFQSKGSSLNQIFDHCSFAFGFFQAASWYEGGGNYEVDNVTVQRSFFAESSRGVMAGTISGGKTRTGKFSFLSNAFYNISHRVPNISGDNGRIDVINNIVWYVKHRLMQANGSIVLNHLGNYYNYNDTPATNYMFHNFGSNTNVLPKIYTNGNTYVAKNTLRPISNSISQINSNNSLAFKYFVGKNYGDQLPTSYFTNRQHVLNGEPFKVLSGDEAYIDVKNNVGCNARLNEDGSVSDNLDVLDVEWLNNIKNGIHSKKPLSQSQWKVPKINSIKRPGDFYSSNPHIPETFFKAHVPKGQNHNDIAPSGYTWLEEYLNRVDGHNFVMSSQKVAIIPSSGEIKISDEIQLTVKITPTNVENKTGKWHSSDSRVATVDATGLVTAISEGNANITFKINESNMMATAEVSVLPQPEEESSKVDAGQDQSICIRTTGATLTATGGATYIWSTGNKTASIKVFPNKTTTYSVTAFDSNGKKIGMDNVVVKVNQRPYVRAGKNVTINQGESTTLTATGASTYLWSNGATTASITVSPDRTTFYSVVGTSAEGCVNDDRLLVMVKNTTYYVDKNNGVVSYKAPSGGSNSSPRPSMTSVSVGASGKLGKINGAGNTDAFDFLVHPNPTNGELHINISGLTHISNIELYDLSGKSFYNEVIYDIDQKNYIKTLDLSDYTSGIYLLRLVDNERSIIKKIILN
ncbi:Ig-like domain-containing protein [Gelidibacter mesophilus]|uniref:Ig-like domain-containing protein n=1 Tax=Gelidibacter mesophilus TaxID=169050 RepID=UPI0004207E67|nr:Ig-like domain-containing protein [Gelidibacter mesophilus]